jgi:HK97 family phage portal protein
MGLLTSIVTGRPIGATYQPWDNFWYQPFSGTATASGYSSSPESAMRIGAVYACVGLLADMVGTLPLILYREVSQDERERAKTHPTYNLLRRQPNPRQTAKEWRTLGMNYLLWRGNFYSRIEYDGRFAVRALWPLHPDRVRVTLLSNGRRGYLYRPPQGPDVALTADEVLHVMAPVSLDEGLTGAGVLEFARESIGTAGAQEQHAGKVWSDGGEPKSALKRTSPGQPFTKEQKQELLNSWRERANKVVILEGLEYQQLGMTGRDMQFIEGRKFSVADIARFFRVPPHMIGDVDGSTSWGTGIEQQTMGFVNFTLMPWLEAFTQALDRDVIPEEHFFVEFLLDALLRPDTLQRYQAYGIGIMNGVLAENEARVRENLKPWPGLWEPRRSANQDRGGNPDGPRQDVPPPAPRRFDEDDEDEAAADRAWKIALASADRIVRREVAVIRKWAPRFADDASLRKWAAEFSAAHVDELVQALALDTVVARKYCADLCAAIVSGRGEFSDEYERNQPAALARLAFAGPRED